MVWKLIINVIEGISATEVSGKMHQPTALNFFSLKLAGSQGENNIFFLDYPSLSGPGTQKISIDFENWIHINLKS